MTDATRTTSVSPTGNADDNAQGTTTLTTDASSDGGPTDASLTQDDVALRKHAAYGASETLAARVAEAVLDPVARGGAVLVQDSAGMVALRVYRAFCATTELLVAWYEDIGNGGGAPLVPGERETLGVATLPAALSSVQSILGTLTGIMSMLKPQTQISTLMLTPSDELLAAGVCGFLARRHTDGDGADRGTTGHRIRVYYPLLFPPEVSASRKTLVKVAQAVGAVLLARHDAVRRIAQLPPSERPDAEARLKQVDLLVERLEQSLIGGALPDAPLPSGASPPEGASRAGNAPEEAPPSRVPQRDTEGPLAQLLGGAIREEILGEDGHLLILKHVSVGGIRRSDRNFLRDSAKYGGMAVGSYFLFRADGTLLNAGTERVLTAFVERDD